MCVVSMTELAQQDGTRLWSPCWSITLEGPVTFGGGQESQGLTPNTAGPWKSSISQDEGRKWL